MKLLLVDDEPYVVRAMQKKINWQELGIDEVFTAFNAKRAKDILQMNPVDIVVTDIEMPMESGLELLAWAREKQYTFKAICFTSHAEFHYAQDALRYGVMEYLLKPLNMEKFRETISKAAAAIEQEKEKSDKAEKGILWDYNRGQIQSDFWKRLVAGQLSENPDEIARYASRVNISYDVNEQYLLVLFSVREVLAYGESWEENPELMKNILYNILCDCISEIDGTCNAAWLDSCLFAIFDPAKKQEVLVCLDNFLSTSSSVAGAKIAAYMDEACFGEDLFKTWRKLLEYNRQNVSVDQGIICGEPSAGKRADEAFGQFPAVLRKKLSSRAFDSMQLWISEQKKDGERVDKRDLFLCVMECTHEIYSFLEEINTPKEAYWNETMVDLWEKANHSVHAFWKWMSVSLEKLSQFSRQETEEKAVIREIQQYVRKNIEERITRDQIASQVCLSTDYVSRLYKKETGMSLSEYIMRQKIERAKELMEVGDDNIGEIAVRLGYNSFSYFTELFRRFTGCLPSDYKRESNGKTVK